MAFNKYDTFVIYKPPKVTNENLPKLYKDFETRYRHIKNKNKNKYFNMRGEYVKNMIEEREKIQKEIEDKIKTYRESFKKKHSSMIAGPIHSGLFISISAHDNKKIIGFLSASKENGENTLKIGALDGTPEIKMNLLYKLLSNKITNNTRILLVNSRITTSDKGENKTLLNNMGFKRKSNNKGWEIEYIKNNKNSVRRNNVTKGTIGTGSNNKIFNTNTTTYKTDSHKKSAKKLMKLLAFLNHHNKYIIKQVKCGGNFGLELTKMNNVNNVKTINNVNTINKMEVNVNNPKTMTKQSRMYTGNNDDARDICVHLLNVLSGKSTNIGISWYNIPSYNAYIKGKIFESYNPYNKKFNNIRNMIQVKEEGTLRACPEIELKTITFTHVPIFIKMCEMLVEKANNQIT